MNDKPMSAYGRAPIKMEGGITDPDEYEWRCDCRECDEKYNNWKSDYDEQQKQLRGEA